MWAKRKALIVVLSANRITTTRAHLGERWETIVPPLIVYHSKIEKSRKDALLFDKMCFVWYITTVLAITYQTGRVKMKRFWFVAILVVWFCMVAATGPVSQEPEGEKKDEPATKLEAFLATRGQLIIKDVYSLGTVPGQYAGHVKIAAVVVYMPDGEGEAAKGLTIEVNDGAKYERSDTAYLDLEELEGLSEAVRYMAKLVASWQETNKDYSEVVFSTKADSKVGFFQSGKKQAAFASCGRVDTVRCFLISPSALGVLGGMVDRGLELLKEK